MRSSASRRGGSPARSVTTSQELVGRPSYKIAKLGIGYVPQGRRLFPSLSVDEPPADDLPPRLGQEVDAGTRLYELFPRLAERRRNGGGQLSGGEQQMLAIGRRAPHEPRPS